MTEQLDILALVTSRLDAAGIAYMVTGSMAAGFYGQPRMTRDVDLVVDLREGEAEHLVELLSDVFLIGAESAKGAVARQTMFNAIHREALVKVDFVIRKAEPFRQEEFARRRRVDLDGHSMWMVSGEDLILSKLLWGRAGSSEVQRRDVCGVIATQQERLDWSYLRAWADRLGVAADLEAARS